MTYYFLLLVIALSVVPANLENYDVLIITIPTTNRKKSVEVFLLPRSFMWSNRYSFSRLDVEDFDEQTETSDEDKLYFRSLPDKAEPLRSLARTFDETQEDDLNNVDDYNRIVGGVEVDINMYPYHVQYGTNCAGSIIGPKWILTAGHCKNKPSIRSGSTIKNEGKVTLVARYHIHPKWQDKIKEHPFDYDFQVLELKENLEYDENTQPVKLARIEDLVVGKEVTVMGWGNMAEHGEHSYVLRAVNVPIVSKENCQKVPFPYFRGALTPRMFCAGYIEGLKDACQGDSGGPAVAKERLLGIVSFGYGCATPGAYGVYSKVPLARDWIESVTGLDLY